jgi:hypothetical protein
MGKIESSLKMFSRVIAQGFKIKHQLTHLIGMYKTPKTIFEYMGSY